MTFLNRFTIIFWGMRKGNQTNNTKKTHTQSPAQSKTKQQKKKKKKKSSVYTASFSVAVKSHNSFEFNEALKIYGSSEHGLINCGLWSVLIYVYITVSVMLSQFSLFSR